MSEILDPKKSESRAQLIFLASLFHPRLSLAFALTKFMGKTGIGHQNSKSHKKRNAQNPRQQSFLKTKWEHRYSHGGILRNKRAGRSMRPLSCKDPLHLVFKIHSTRLHHGSLRSARCFSLANRIIKKYSGKFFVKIEQLSIQGNHIHALVRTGRRSQYHAFFRVVAGQIAQQFQKEGLLKVKAVTDTSSVTLSETSRDTSSDTTSSHLKKIESFWKYRPFTRVIKGWKAYLIVKDYIQLNEKEALMKIPYQKLRLRGLSSGDWELLWS